MYKIKNYFSNIYWWVCHRFVKRHKYNNVYTKLSPGWHPTNNVMLYACFRLLEQYCEEYLLSTYYEEDTTYKSIVDKVIHTLNDLHNNIDQGDNVEHWLVILECYKWWKLVYPNFLEQSRKNLENYEAILDKKYDKWKSSDSSWLPSDATIITDEEKIIYYNYIDEWETCLEQKEKEEKEYLLKLISCYEWLND